MTQPTKFTKSVYADYHTNVARAAANNASKSDQASFRSRRQAALEERREIEANTKEVWEE